MDYTKGYFYSTYIPCTDQRLVEIEESLGLQLPEGYRELLRQTGGGQLSIEKSYIRIPAFRPGYAEEVENILGNTDSDLDSNSIVGSPEHMGPEVWGASEGLLIFAYCGNGPVSSFGINYGLKEFPPLSIIYDDVELGNELAKVADSFEEFMGMLTTDDEVES